MKAIALATAFAFASILPTLAAAESLPYRDIGVQQKMDRPDVFDALAAKRDLTDDQIASIVIEAYDDEMDIVTSEEVERMLDNLSPQEREIAMRIFGADIEAE